MQDLGQERLNLKTISMFDITYRCLVKFGSPDFSTHKTLTDGTCFL